MAFHEVKRNESSFKWKADKHSKLQMKEGHKKPGCLVSTRVYESMCESEVTAEAEFNKHIVVELKGNAIDVCFINVHPARTTIELPC